MTWFGRMSGVERRTFWGCFGGWALDAMDVQIYALVMPTLVAAWGMTQGQAGTLGTAALLTSALGGWIAGMLADRIGRVRVLQLTILWFAAFTFLSGLTQTYDQLLITRSLQGLGFGGEWATGATLMAEVMTPATRGRAVGCVQSGWSVGYGIATILFAITFHLLPADQAWRAMFFLGGLPAVLALMLRRSLQDSAVYQASKEKPASSVWDIFRAPVRRSTIVASLLAAGALGGNYTILTWLPTYLRTVHHLSFGNTASYLSINILGSFAGYVISAHLSDWLGRRRTFALMAFSAAVTIAVYTLGDLRPMAILLMGFPLGFFQSGIVAGMGACFAELFPTRVRANGQGFSYNLGRGMGSVLPALVGLTGGRLGLPLAIGGFAVASYLLVLVVTLALPETRGQDLTARA